MSKNITLFIQGTFIVIVVGYIASNPEAFSSIIRAGSFAYASGVRALKQ